MKLFKLISPEEKGSLWIIGMVEMIPCSRAMLEVAVCERWLSRNPPSHRLPHSWLFAVCVLPRKENLQWVFVSSSFIFRFNSNGIKSHSFKDKLITLSISIPVTETVNLRLLLSIPVIVVKDLENKISSSYTPELKMFFFLFSLEVRFFQYNYKSNNHNKDNHKDQNQSCYSW